MNRNQRRHLEERLFKFIMRAALFVTLGMLAAILFTVVRKGIGAMSWSMISEASTGGSYLGEAEGGILNAILGSLYLAGGATVLALLFGLPVALYLHTYMGQSKLADYIRLVFDILWGIPSIVYGVFGFTLMLLIGMRASLLAGILTLALVELPILVRTIDEVLRMVPPELSEITYALGTTRLELMGILTRQSLPGLVTAILLAFGRGIGDAAAVLFTAGYTDSMPDSLMRPVASLPLSIFFQLSSPFPSVQARAYASALVLTILVLVISLLTRLSMRTLSKHVVR
ncbi:MAG TPA: PstA family ABC transporter permease [Aggregatilineaceae bacterium]|nr:PstA family ABC transporter permease [Aggregatilineaceae bacterium]